ncbi:DNA helicase Pif1-like protein [Artemisia annua]|uniref:DNA helicase Pif1-like protein n=1 Tax=Artemisia annua TaxID=35608 RepID=A0A2U1MMM9_ARTAN|nr:DNA helicase Pif1-like protein [Artemisia annua]
MASSNPKNIKDTNSHAFGNNYKSDDATFVAPKPEPKPNSQDGVRSEQSDSQLDEALRFLKSVFEDGDSSMNKKDELYVNMLLDWLKLNVGDHDECQNVLKGVQSKLLKADGLINELRAMGHELTDDYIVDLNFFRLNFQTANNVLPLNSHVPLATQLSPLTPAAATDVRRTTTSTFQSQLGPVSYTPLQQTNILTSSSTTGLKGTPTSGPFSLMANQPETVRTGPSYNAFVRTPPSRNSTVSTTPLASNTSDTVNHGTTTSNALQTSCDQVTSVAATLSLQTPSIRRANQCSNIISMPCVRTTIPAVTTGKSTYEVGESSRSTKRSKRPALRSQMPVRFNLNVDGGDARKEYDKYIGVSEAVLLRRLVKALQVTVLIETLSLSEQNIKIKLIANRGKDGRNYNLPTSNEVAGLIVGDFDTCIEDRDIVIEKHREGLQRINIFHPMYLPLQYPLLMPRAQDGYYLGIPHRKKAGRHPVRPSNSSPVRGKNGQNSHYEGVKFLVDGCTMVETERLFYHRSKQTKLRCDTYSNIRQSVASEGEQVDQAVDEIQAFLDCR